MTENELRQAVVDQAKYWLGRKEADQSHRVIIDVYNSIVPLPRGYRMTYTDPWCAAFVSAVAQVCGLTDIIFPECGCEQMIELYKQAGRWEEDDAYVPKPGDIIFYDWQDDGTGDDTGTADHVGIVTKEASNVIYVIEGNSNDAVQRVLYKVNSKFFRGFGLPDYASMADGEEEPDSGATDTNVGGKDNNVPTTPEEPDPEPDPQPARYSVDVPLLQKGDRGGYVQAAQILLILRGCSVGPDGADGDFGSNTQSAVYAFQRRKGLAYDGIIGPATWAALLRG